MNDAPSLSNDVLVERVDQISIDEDWVDDMLINEHSQTDVERQYAFVREFRISGGITDPKPIELEDINLIRRLGNRATYQFTLKRYSYHPADREGCNGLFVHDAFYGDERLSCLVTLSANRVRTVRRFPEWYLDE